MVGESIGHKKSTVIELSFTLIFGLEIAIAKVTIGEVHTHVSVNPNSITHHPDDVDKNKPMGTDEVDAVGLLPIRDEPSVTDPKC